MLKVAPRSSLIPLATRFAGLRFTPMTVAQTLAVLAARDAGEPFSAFVTPNAEHAYLRRVDAEFRACGEACLVSTNDSRVLRAVAWLAGLDLMFAPGAYVVRALFQDVIAADEPITIVGCTPDLVDHLKARFDLTQVAHHNPPMGFIHDEAAVRAAMDFVAAHPARFVFIAMGPPQSEKFCQRVLKDGRSTGVGLCIGSSLAVLTEAAEPAPDWMEHSGLVWLYRLVREPRRLWRRYLVHGLYGLTLAMKDVVLIRLGVRRAWDV